MKILEIVPEINGGGVGSVVCNYLTHMVVGAKDEMEILAYDLSCRQLFENELKKNNIKVRYIMPRRKNNMIEHFRMINQLMKDEKFDIVHCHLQNWSAIYLSIAKKNGVKTRIAHSHLTKSNFKLSGSYIMSESLKPFLKLYATHWMACGKEAAINMWGKEAYSNGKVCILNNAINIEKFKYNSNIRSSLRAEMKLSDKLIIGHIGRFENQKNHRYLLQIFVEILSLRADAILILIGEGSLKNEIMKLADSLNISEYVIFMGMIDDTENFYQIMDGFILPSLYEGLPVVGIEAQANGLPCLMSDSVTDEIEILKSTKRMSLSASPKLWAKELLNLISTNEAECLRVSAFKEVRSGGYDITLQGAKLKQFYENSLKDN